MSLNFKMVGNYIILFFLMTCINSYAVTNQELMDRLDDIEFDQQMREMNREMDRQLQEYIKQSSQLPSVSPTPNSQTKKKSYATNSNSQSVCSVYWDGSRFKLGETATSSDFKVYKNGNDLVIAIPKSLSSSLNENSGVGKDVNSSKFVEFMRRHWSQIEHVCQREFK
jgi:hypothetical protein